MCARGGDVHAHVYIAYILCTCTSRTSRTRAHVYIAYIVYTCTRVHRVHVYTCTSRTLCTRVHVYIVFRFAYRMRMRTCTSRTLCTRVHVYIVYTCASSSDSRTGCARTQYRGGRRGAVDDGRGTSAARAARASFTRVYIMYRRRRPCGAAFNTLVDLNKLALWCGL